MELKGSKTEEILRRAFARELRVNANYMYCASAAREAGLEEILHVSQVGRLLTVEERDRLAVLLHPDEDRILVVVEVVAQLAAGAQQLLSSDAGGLGGIVVVGGVLVQTRLVDRDAHVGGDEGDGKGDDEEQRGDVADEPQTTLPCRSAPPRSVWSS